MAGCIGDEASPASPSNDSLAQANASINGTIEGPRLTEAVPLVETEHPLASQEGDVLCLFGGGPKHDRTEGNHVLPGTSEITVRIEVPETSMSNQVGYVLDSNRAEHAPENNRTITWLPKVGPGSSETFTVPVDPGQFEEPGEMRWTFYRRIQPQGVDDVCYTGTMVGPFSLEIVAHP